MIKIVSILYGTCRIYKKKKKRRTDKKLLLAKICLTMSQLFKKFEEFSIRSESNLTIFKKFLDF